MAYIDSFVVVRTQSAGVHTGVLESLHGTCVILKDARRIWSWTEAFTLNEIALRGCGEESRISNPIGSILLTEAIEVIPCTTEAEANLRRTRNTGESVSTGRQRRTRSRTTS